MERAPVVETFTIPPFPAIPYAWLEMPVLVNWELFPVPVDIDTACVDGDRASVSGCITIGINSGRIFMAMFPVAVTLTLPELPV